MKDIFRILLISLLSFTIISCSNKDKSESSGSNIQLSNIKANLAGKSLFISTGNKSSYSTTNKSSSTNRSQYKSDSQLENTSLFALSTESQLDYGILSDYKLEIDELIPYSNNEYAIATLSYGTYLDYDSEYNQNIRDLNCGILNIEISKTSVSCLAEGIVIPNIYHRVMYGYAGKINESVIIGKNDELFFSSIPDETSFKQTADLKCSSGNRCLYKYNPVNKTTVKLNEGNDYLQFILLNNNHVVFKSTPSKVYAALLLIDNNNELTTIASTTISDSDANDSSIDPYHIISGDHISVFHQEGKIFEKDIFELSDLVGISLILFALHLAAKRWRDREIERYSELSNCPKCGGKLQHVQRTPKQKIISFFYVAQVKHYSCRSCTYAGIKMSKKT